MNRSEFTEESVARYWDDNADLWTDLVRRKKDSFREYFNNPAFFKFIDNLDGKTVLDAGCGEGYNTRLLAKQGANMVGIDISQRMIELAQQEEKRKPLGINYKATSFSDLSLFNDEAFDVVVSFMSLMDGPEFQNALKEIFRVLRPEGEIIFSITHPCFITKGFQWMCDEKGNYNELTVSNYFDETPSLEYWKFRNNDFSEDDEPFTVPRFLRPISEYINELITAGFLLTRIQEPRPSEEACEQHPWLRRWRDHAAIFLYVRAFKPIEKPRIHL